MAEEKPICRAITRGGGRCKKPATDQQGFCWSHSGASAQARKRIAAAGGKARRAPSELDRIKDGIETITTAVIRRDLDGSNNTIDRNTAAVIYQGYNVLLRAIEVQRRLDHQQDLEEQVAALRGRLDELRGRRRG